MHRTRPTTLHRQAERNTCCPLDECTPLQSLGRLLRFTTLGVMKYGKYELHKSSANLSIGTSYSWYYRKNENLTNRKKPLTRAASDSTLFSDYANQIALFEKELSRNKKCKKSVSDVGKNTRVKCNVRNIEPVHMEPFTGNFFYGKPLPGYEYSQKTEEKLNYLPDSDAVTASEDTTAESLTTAPTVVDIPEYIKNPLYGCIEAGDQLHVSTPECSINSTFSKDSQLKSSSCTELKETMNGKEQKDILSTILKDYKKIMKEWNYTVKDHCSAVSHCSKKSSTMCRRSNTDSYVRSLHSTLSYRKPRKCRKSINSNHCLYASIKNCKRYQNLHQRKTQSLNRNLSFTNWTSTLQHIRKKSMFWKINKSLTPSECKCLQTIYKDYDRRLQEWCDTVSQCSSMLNSVIDIKL
ncbi:uncharacterized protein LOC115441280 [Manduca sexta]|uniref:uncharacterized protein LOC115441280 n=1 Tax=Manduca sexta TaxID=7130 RepID=UPI001183977C|nr:uncharacterized protein LOC115441280 [Manduca sexta]